MKNELENFVEFEKQNPELSGVKSEIWKVFSQDFSGKEYVRGYGVNNTYSFKRIERYLKANNAALSLQSIIVRIGKTAGRVIKDALSGFFSLVFLGNVSAGKKYSFKYYSINIYYEYDRSTGYLRDFLGNDSLYGVGFSHHTFKAYTYYRRFEKLTGVMLSDMSSVCEVGAGMLNFGTLMFQESTEMNYIVVDLPEMILSSSYEANKVLHDVSVFLPHQIEEYNKSDSKKKLLYILPGQLDSLDKKFDLIVNHESFAEMDIVVVNDYLKTLENKMVKGGYCFLVNRLFRVQAASDDQYFRINNMSSMTQFCDYYLGWLNVVYFDVDDFRQLIPNQNKNPNVLYVGKK